MTSTLGVKREQVERLREPDADTFAIAQVDPNRIQQLVHDWLQRRGISTTTTLVYAPVSSAS